MARGRRSDASPAVRLRRDGRAEASQGLALALRRGARPPGRARIDQRLRAHAAAWLPARPGRSRGANGGDDGGGVAVAIESGPPVAVGTQHDLPHATREDERLPRAVNPVEPPLPEQMDRRRRELGLLGGDGVARALAEHGLDGRVGLEGLSLDPEEGRGLHEACPSSRRRRSRI